jgi:hypothetical protein
VKASTKGDVRIQVVDPLLQLFQLQQRIVKALDFLSAPVNYQLILYETGTLTADVWMMHHSYFIDFPWIY